MNDVDADQELLTKGLVRILAGTLLLRCKARFFAWSLDDNSQALQTLLYEDYSILDRLCDNLATLIASLGGRVPGAYSVLAEISSVKEDAVMPAENMAQKIKHDHLQLINDTLFIESLLQTSPSTDVQQVLDQALVSHEQLIAQLECSPGNPPD